MFGALIRISRGSINVSGQWIKRPPAFFKQEAEEQHVLPPKAPEDEDHEHHQHHDDHDDPEYLMDEARGSTARSCESPRSHEEFTHLDHAERAAHVISQNVSGPEHIEAEEGKVAEGEDSPMGSNRSNGNSCVSEASGEVVLGVDADVAVEARSESRLPDASYACGSAENIPPTSPQCSSPVGSRPDSASSPSTVSWQPSGTLLPLCLGF